METQEVIKIVPSDNMFYELGKTNYTLEEALSELIDNSISARIDNSLQIDICFKIDKNTKKCNELIITDNASGIKKKNIGACISPAEK
nr:ATP-binding protein [Candidatus Dojkabacteria bacterium]